MIKIFTTLIAVTPQSFSSRYTIQFLIIYTLKADFKCSYAGILSKCKKSPINQSEARNLMQLELLHYNHFREQKSGTENMDLILDMHIFSWWTMVQRNVYHLTSLNFGQLYLNNLKVSTCTGDFLSFSRAEYQPHSHLKITTFFHNSVSMV